MAFWRSEEIDQPALWAAYCAAQARDDAYLMRAPCRLQPKPGARYRYALQLR